MHYQLNIVKEIFDFFKALAAGMFDPNTTMTAVLIALAIPVLTIILRYMIKAREERKEDLERMREYEEQARKGKETATYKYMSSLASREMMAAEERRKKILAKRYPGLSQEKKEKTSSLHLAYYVLLGLTILAGIFLVIKLIGRISQ